jgi:MSHA biogenesis protein MshJ
MSAAWKKLAARIDALGLRERVFLFLSVIVVCVAVVDSLWVSPARLQHQQVRQQFDANAVEMRQLQDEQRLKALQPDPARQLREEFDKVRAQIETSDRSISALSAVAVGATSLPDLLVHFLRRHQSLSLVRTSSVTVQPALPAAEQSGGSVRAAPSTVARHGQELTIAGPYPALIAYVRALETAMPDLRWGALTLKAEQQPPELTVQVFLVGSKP